MKWILLMLLYAASFLYSQDIKKLEKKAERYSLNFEFDKAEETALSGITKYPDEPYFNFILARNNLWFFLGTREEKYYAKFEKYASEALSKTGKQKRSPEKEYLLGKIHTLYAMARGERGESYGALSSADDAVEHYEESLDQNPKFYDAYLGLGIFNYALSFIPTFYQRLLFLTGLESDRHKGFEYIRRAAAYGKIDRDEASYHLAKLYTEYLGDFDTGITLLERLTNEYPGNSLFHYQLGILLYKNRELQKAEGALLEAVRTSPETFRLTKAFAYFVLGDVSLRRNSYEEAVKYYEQFIYNTVKADYTGIARLRMAYSFYFLNKKDEFRRSLMLASNGNMDVREDEYARKKSSEILKNGISSQDSLLLLNVNRLFAGEYKKVTDDINKHLDGFSGKNKGKALALAANSELNLGRKKNSVLLAEDALKYKTENDWLFTLAAFTAAKANLNSGLGKKAEEFIKVAEDLNDRVSEVDLAPEINLLKEKTGSL